MFERLAKLFGLTIGYAVVQLALRVIDHVEWPEPETEPEPESVPA
jgi:hypothetical protein